MSTLTIELPESLMKSIEALAMAEGYTVSQFLASAAGEKLAVLRTMEANGLARWKLPECVMRVDGPLPMTATGKVQRRELFETTDVIWRADRL